MYLIDVNSDSIDANIIIEKNIYFKENIAHICGGAISIKKTLWIMIE